MNQNAELLRQYSVERSERAFNELVRRNLGLVYATALRRLNGDPHKAKDVTQIVFIKVAENARALADHPALAGWLHTTVHNSASEILRAERRREKREQEASVMEEPDCNSSGPLDWDRLRPMLDDALQSLDTGDREAVLLRYFQGCSFGEIGMALGLRDNAARMRVERALDKLHGQLAKRGIASTAAALAVSLANQSVAIPVGLAAEVAEGALVAVAQTAGGGALALAKFMITSKILGGIAVAIAIVASGTAIYEARRAHELQEATDLAGGENDRLRGELTQSEKRASDAQLYSSKLQAEMDRLKPASQPATASGAASQSARPASAASAMERSGIPLVSGGMK